MSTGARPKENRSRRRAPRLLCSALLAVLMLASVPLSARAQPASAAGAFPEDAVKAVFLYRFAGYVGWPIASAPPSRFVLAVMGADDVVAQLERLLPDHPIHGLPAEVHRIQGLQSLGDAQMLYVGPNYDGSLAELIARLRSRAVLVVTDRDGALEAGSMMNFLLQSDHVRFEVSLIAARRAGLTISSDLLAVAQRVKTGNRDELPLCAPLEVRPASCSRRVATR